MVVAVAAGAVAAASQGFAQPVGTDASTLLALGSDLTGYSGRGGNGPASGALAQLEVLPVAQNTLAADMTSLAKGQRIAEERASAAAQEAAQRAEAQDAAQRAEARAAQERAAERAARPIRKLAGQVVMPADGVLTSGFGARWGTTHYGIDIANSIGTPIYATTDGVVVESGPASGFGMWVRLRHNDGTISVYGHINQSLVTEGERVSAGEQIATMGNRGQSTGPHLHFEIWLNGTEKVNPLTWLRNQGVDV